MNDRPDRSDSPEESDDPPIEPNDPTDGSVDEADDPEEQWRFTLADIEAREAQASAEAEAEARRQEPIEPGEPSTEGTAFVLLGVIFTLFVISRLLVG